MEPVRADAVQLAPIFDLMPPTPTRHLSSSVSQQAYVRVDRPSLTQLRASRQLRQVHIHQIRTPGSLMSLNSSKISSLRIWQAEENAVGMLNTVHVWDRYGSRSDFESIKYLPLTLVAGRLRFGNKRCYLSLRRSRLGAGTLMCKRCAALVRLDTSAPVSAPAHAIISLRARSLRPTLGDTAFVPAGIRLALGDANAHSSHAQLVRACTHARMHGIAPRAARVS